MQLLGYNYEQKKYYVYQIQLPGSTDVGVVLPLSIRISA